MSEQFYQEKRDQQLKEGFPIYLEAFIDMDQNSIDQCLERAYDALLENVVIEASHMQMRLGLTTEQLIKDYVALLWFDSHGPFIQILRARVTNRARIESDFFTVADFIPNGFDYFYLDSDTIRKEMTKLP